MNFLAPLIIYGWIPVTIILFKKLPSPKAVLISVIGGVLFLPMASFDLPGLIFNKSIAISLGLLFGEMFSYGKREYSVKLEYFDLPMIIWCTFSPVFTSLTNGLGLYDGISAMINTTLTWGVFYWTGRKYFYDASSLSKISRAILIGGLIYLPLCLFEVRMSPQLSKMIYNIFPHAWHQHVRNGHFRPIVFMQHGLMVALWMTISSITAFWLWKDKKITHIKSVPMFLIIVLLFITTLLTRSAGAISFLIIGTVSWFIYSGKGSTKFFRYLLLIVPLYIFLRVYNILSVENIEIYFSKIFNPQRIYSLVFRLDQEDLFSVKALEQPLFGWGGWGRGRPIDPDTGRIIKIVDSLWLITFSKNGFIGLISLFTAMLIGPWKVLSNKITLNNQSIDSIILSLAVIFFMLDSLLNGMVNPVYILCAGALLSYRQNLSDNSIIHSYLRKSI